MQGNVIFNIGQLYEANTVKDGRIVESNFHDFPLPKLTEDGPRWKSCSPPRAPSGVAMASRARSMSFPRPQRRLRRDGQASSVPCP
jgi:hypothetical protein